MAQAYAANNRAFQAHWYRLHASNLAQIGQQVKADEWMKRAEIIEQELKDNKQCLDCGKPLRDFESVSAGRGPDCRKKLRRVS